MNIDIVRAEWTKARTVRSTWWSLVVAAALCIGLAVLWGLSAADSFERMDAERRANWDPVFGGFMGLTIGQIALVVFGVLLATAEYASGTIRASLAAVPRRWLFLGAKLAVGGAIGAAISVVVVFGSFVVAQNAMGELGVSLGAPGAGRAIVGSCVYLTLITVFSAAVGMLLRSTALSLGIMIPILFLNSQGLSHAPGIREVAQFLPDQAGMVLMQARATTESYIMTRDYGFAGALGILVAWTAIAVAGGYLVLRRRDA